MIKKITNLLLLLLILISQINIIAKAQTTPVAQQHLSAFYTKNPENFEDEEEIVIPQPDDENDPTTPGQNNDDTQISETIPQNGDDGGGLSTGGIVGIAVGTGGGVAAAGGALAMAPVFMAGLIPNGIIGAAAPIDCYDESKNYLRQILVENYKPDDIQKIVTQKRIGSNFYITQNDTVLNNNGFNIQEFKIPDELFNYKQVKMNVIMYSDPYRDIEGDPELAFGAFKNIELKTLSKKFETQQFLHNYIMNRYKMPLEINLKNYGAGKQTLSGIIDMTKFKTNNNNWVVVRYTKGGFNGRKARLETPTQIVYAYLIELIPIK